MKRFLEFFKNTTVRLVSFLLLGAFILSLFVFSGFYKKQCEKVLSFYYVYQGDNYYKRNKPQEAINSYIRALELYPKHYKAQYNLANIYVVYEDYYSALDAYSKALEVKPDFTVARIDYAIVLSEAAFNYDKAIEQYNLAIEKTPKWVYIPFIIDNKHSYKYNKGVAYYNRGLAWRGKSLLHGEDLFTSRKYLENAVLSYERALKILKTYDVYYNLAIAHHLLKNPNEAGYYYCKAIEKEPLKYEAHYNLAILLRNMKRYAESVEEFKKAGLLLDVRGDVNKTRYIYDVLSEVMQKYAASDEYVNLKETFDNEENASGNVTYVNGKMVVTEEFDRAMLKNFKTCASKEFFENTSGK